MYEDCSFVITDFNVDNYGRPIDALDLPVLKESRCGIPKNVVIAEENNTLIITSLVELRPCTTIVAVDKKDGEIHFYIHDDALDSYLSVNIKNIYRMDYSEFWGTTFEDVIEIRDPVGKSYDYIPLRLTIHNLTLAEKVVPEIRLDLAMEKHVFRHFCEYFGDSLAVRRYLIRKLL